MEKLQRSHDVTVAWHSFELRPKGAPPIDPAYLARIQAARPQLYARARQDYGEEINPGPFGIDTRPALIGAKFAEAQGAGPAYHAAVMDAYWRKARNIEDVAVLADIAQAAGLDADAFALALADPAHDGAVSADVDQAQIYGLTGVPALVFNNKYLIPGAQPYPALAQAVEQIRQQEGGNGGNGTDTGD